MALSKSPCPSRSSVANCFATIPKVVRRQRRLCCWLLLVLAEGRVVWGMVSSFTAKVVVRLSALEANAAQQAFAR